MITPPATKTLKTLSATLLGAWIITDPEWVTKCVEKTKIVDESAYGFRLSSNPFTGKNMHRTPEFLKQCQNRKSCSEWLKFLEILWIECSKGHFVDDISEADYVLLDDNDTAAYGDLSTFTWYTLMDQIPSKRVDSPTE